MSNHRVSTGYGVLSNEYDFASDKDMISNGDVNHINHIPLNSSSHSTPLILAKNGGINRSYYGSLVGSESTTDSYNQWYIEGYGSDFDVGLSGSIQEAVTAHETPDYCRRQSNPYDTEGENEFFCEESCCVDKDGAVILSSEHVNQLLGYPSGGETSGTEQTYHSHSCEKKNKGIASTPLVSWNILNLLLSTSLLAFPFAVSRGGFVVLPFILLISVMTNYTSRLLINMMYEQSATYHGRQIRVRLDYVDLAQDVFNSYRGAWFIQIIQVFEMLAICVLNICVLGSLGNEIMSKVGIQLCTVIAALLALPSFFIRKLVVIGWLQTIGIFSLTIGLILVQGYCVANYSKWKMSSVPVFNLHALPIAVGIIIYAFGIQSVMPGLEQQMKMPKKFGYVVNLTFCIAVLVQCLFSFTNSIFYGPNTYQVITIDLECHFAMGVATACFIAISILCHFSLPTFVVMEKLDNAIHRMFPCCPSHGDNRFHTFLTVSLRLIVMSFSLGIAVLLPYFAYLMSFIGSAITVLLSLIVPCWFHLKLRWSSITWYQTLANVFIILFGLASMGFGSYYSFDAIYNNIVN